MKIHELIDDTPSTWNKSKFAINKYNEETDARSEDAICWCLEGLIRKCYPILLERNQARFKIKDEILKNNPEYSPHAAAIGIIVNWNDRPERTFQDIKDLVLKLDV